MNKHLFFLFVVLFFGCKTTKITSPSIDDGKIEFAFLHINDVYEISPLENGKIGGMARVATLNKQLKNENRNTMTLLAGDFLSPSLIGTIKLDGKRIKGKQMVETMNSAGVDLVTFGNHEFDLEYEELQERINESTFQWISSNVLNVDKQGIKNRFFKIENGTKKYVPDHLIWEIKDADGTTAKIGIFGVTLATFQKPFTFIEDFELESRKAVQHLSNSCDLIIAVTHLEQEQDSLLALMVPEVPLIMGGHDHDNMIFKSGNSTIAKADANAKTAYVHRFSLNKRLKSYNLQSKLVRLDSTISIDPVADAVVQKWEKIKLEKIKDIIPDPFEVVYHATTPLDGREISIRFKQTNLGNMIAAAMMETTKAEAAILNSGSIRIDDQLSGNLTAIDIFRALPFGGQVMLVEMKGSLLKEVLDAGENSRDKGAFLQRANLDFDKKTAKWLIKGKPLDAKSIYKIAMNDFLLEGLDIPILNKKADGVVKMHAPEANTTAFDLRKAVVAWLKKQR